jgi:uncharacterized membrane protein YbhN (UPF0104 family)
MKWTDKNKKHKDKIHNWWWNRRTKTRKTKIGYTNGDEIDGQRQEKQRFFLSLSVYFITSCVSYLCFSCLCPSISSPVVYPIFVFLVFVCLFHHQLCILSLFFLSLSNRQSDKTWSVIEVIKMWYKVWVFVSLHNYKNK